MIFQHRIVAADLAHDLPQIIEIALAAAEPVKILQQQAQCVFQIFRVIADIFLTDILRHTTGTQSE